MKRAAYLLLIILGCSLMCGCLALFPEWKKGTFARVPDGALLQGYPPASLAISTPKETIWLQDGEASGLAYVSMSSDGMTIAAANQIYSLKERKWTEYSNIRGSLHTISPDGTRLAYIMVGSGPVLLAHLHLTDLRTRKVWASEPIEGTVGTLSWSPDGTGIAYDVNPRDKAKIQILDIKSGTVITIQDARLPAWAPTGEWIAFFDLGANLWLVHPDGTSRHILLSLGKHRYGPFHVFSEEREFHFPVVWSPDSRKLLLNEMSEWFTYVFDVTLIDVSTPKRRRIFKNGPPVYAWAPVPTH